MTQYAKIDCTNEIYAKNWVRRTWTEKVNTGKVNGQWLVNGQRPADDVTGRRGDDVSRTVDADAARADVAEVMTSADQVPTREGAWQRMDGA